MTAALSLLVGIGVRAQSAQTGQSAQNAAPPAPQGPLAPEKFKNIQVLKDVRADEVRPSMEYFTAALGVQCNFCHVTSQFDSDDRPAKKTARQMIQMVERFNGDKTNNITLTCATCHHGHQEPERTPPLAANMTPEEAAAFAARAQQRGAGPGGAPGAGGPAAPGQAGRGRGFQRPTETVDQVVDKYVQAMGGSDALAKAKTRVLKGTVMTRDLVTSPITVQETASGNYRIDIDAKQGPIVRVSNGKDVWVQAFGNTHDLEGVQADQATRLADFDLPTNIKQRYASLTVGRYGNVDGTETIGLSGRVNDDSVEQLQFSRDTGLLVRRSFQRRTPFGALVEQVDYSDYHDVSGVKVPFSVVYTSWNQVTTEKISDATINAPVDDSVFAKK
jgi:cytochrome c553